MIEKRNIDFALETHFEWKNRLLKAIKHGKCESYVEDIAKDNLCVFGKWLYHLPESDLTIAKELNIFELHKNFHLEVAEILHLAVNENRDEALVRIEHGIIYNKVTRNLVLAMHKWKNLID